MIVKAAPHLAPDEAARRAATGADPIWISSPGGARGAGSDVQIVFDAVAAEPMTVIRGASLGDLEAAWREGRAVWSRTGPPPPPDLPIGVGWISYDLARQWFPLAGGPPGDGDGTPLEFRFFDAVWLLDAGASHARIVACDDAAAQRLIDRLAQPGNRPPGQLSPPRLGPLTAAGGDPSEARLTHAAAVAAIKEYLCAGDAYQVNLARRMRATISDGDPLWMATTLRARAPAPHALWMGSRSEGATSIDRYVVGNSPERFLRVTVGGVIETRPIKGTRARAADPLSDGAARAALAAAPKDRAEHVMIVDLERNDLGRVCETGSVIVEDLLRMVELPTVHHLVSTVRGQLRPGVSLPELLRATFPGGSVTGAPKRRAMEIIEELEPARRGLYTGATGWLGGAGDLDLAVAIRTALISGGQMSLSVGGGIVADSDAASEWEETEVKARAFVELCGAAHAEAGRGVGAATTRRPPRPAT